MLLFSTEAGSDKFIEMSQKKDPKGSSGGKMKQ